MSNRFFKGMFTSANGGYVHEWYEALICATSQEQAERRLTEFVKEYYSGVSNQQVTGVVPLSEISCHNFRIYIGFDSKIFLEEYPLVEEAIQAAQKTLSASVALKDVLERGISYNRNCPFVVGRYIFTFDGDKVHCQKAELI